MTLELYSIVRDPWRTEVLREILLFARPPHPKAPIGGAERDRTVDLRLAKPALSQLSYSPGGVVITPPIRGPGQT